MPTQRVLVHLIFSHRLPTSFRPACHAGAFLSTAKQDATLPTLGHLAKAYSPECVEGKFSEVSATLLKMIHRGFIAVCFDEGVRGSATVPKL
jgi:hypothetical protein